jgi:hypothetical protein
MARLLAEGHDPELLSPSGRRPSSAPRQGEGVGPYRDLPSPSPEAAETLRGELRTSWLELAKALEQEQARRAEWERREARGGPTWWEWLGDGLKHPRRFQQPSDASSYEKARRDLSAVVDQAEQTARDRRAGSGLHAGKLPQPLARPATRPWAPPPMPSPPPPPRFLSPKPGRPAEGPDVRHRRLLEELPRGEAAIRAPQPSVSSSAPPALRPKERIAGNPPDLFRPEPAAGSAIADNRVLEELIRIRRAVEDRSTDREDCSRLSPPMLAPPPRPSGRM